MTDPLKQMMGLGSTSQISRTSCNNVAIKPVSRESESEEAQIIFLNRDTVADVEVESHGGIT